MDETEALLLSLRTEIQNVNKQNELLRRQVDLLSHAHVGRAGRTPENSALSPSSAVRKDSAHASEEDSLVDFDAEAEERRKLERDIIHQYVAEIDRLRSAVRHHEDEAKHSRDEVTVLALENERCECTAGGLRCAPRHGVLPYYLPGRSESASPITLPVFV